MNKLILNDNNCFEDLLLKNLQIHVIKSLCEIIIEYINNINCKLIKIIDLSEQKEWEHNEFIIDIFSDPTDDNYDNIYVLTEHNKIYTYDANNKQFIYKYKLDECCCRGCKVIYCKIIKKIYVYCSLKSHPIRILNDYDGSFIRDHDKIITHDYNHDCHTYKLLLRVINNDKKNNDKNNNIDVELIVAQKRIITIFNSKNELEKLYKQKYVKENEGIEIMCIYNDKFYIIYNETVYIVDIDDGSLINSWPCHINNPRDIIVSNDYVYIIDAYYENKEEVTSISIFNTHGNYINNWKIQGDYSCATISQNKMFVVMYINRNSVIYVFQ